METIERILVDRQKFSEAVSAIAPAVRKAKNHSMGDSGTFTILNSWLIASNGFMTIQVSVPVSSKFNCCVRLTSFLALLKSLPQQKMELEITGTGRLLVRADEVEGSFRLFEPENPIQLIDAPAKPQWKEFTDDFISALKWCELVTGRRWGHTILIGQRHVYGRTTYQIIRAPIPQNIGLSGLVLDPTFVKALLKASKLKDFCLDGDRFVARTSNATLCTRSLPSDYSEQELAANFLPDAEFVKIALSGNLNGVIDKHIHFQQALGKEDKVVKFLLSEGKCRLTSEVTGESELVEDVDLESEVDDKLEFSVNPLFLKHLIGVCHEFGYSKKANIIRFKGDKLEYIAAGKFAGVEEPLYLRQKPILD